MKIESTSSLSRINLNSRLWLSFSFATFFPAGILLYYLMNLYAITSLIIFVIIFVIGVGWWFIFDAFSAIESIHKKSQELVKSAEIKKPQFESTTNELEHLDAIFNSLSSKMRESVEELREVSSKTEGLHKEIARKVDILSSMLQANVLFSKGGSADEVFQLLTERLKVILAAEAVITFFRKNKEENYRYFSYGIDPAIASKLLKHKDFSDLLAVKEKTVVTKEVNDMILKFLPEVIKTKKFLINPLYLKNKVVGYVIIASNKEGLYLSGDIEEVVELFSRNMSIVWEHQRLSQKVEDLSTVDSVTGIYNSRFFTVRLDEEIRRAMAYQRPCGLIVLKLHNYHKYFVELKEAGFNKLLKAAVDALQKQVRPIDILGRIKDDSLAVILIERNRRQTHYLGMKLKETIKAFIETKSGIKPDVFLAVAENPLEGNNALALFEHINKQLEG